MRNPGLAAALVATAFLTGCSSTPSDGTPTPSSPSTNSPHSTGNQTHGAPRVTDPLAIDPFLNKPCTSLTEKQVTEYLGADAETRPKTDRSAGPSCAWHSDVVSDAQISVTYPRLGDEGLTAIYRNRNKAAYFTEMDSVDGYPTIASSTIDNRDEGECLVTVGTSDSDYVNIDMYLGDGSVGKVDPCEAAHEVATAVIGNIKAANGGK
ncbi:DUF3558 domain-containing protein [Saccharomonospora xinjiangensis]|uniref:DUF3558 domain-containing protein n=1 Tax=Saccharomonospora xinjiangensis TaxID=75294 RepID=UPI00106FCEE2|nr:DUF3558 domain-containing protein [Saccharomonospora xinjiangensis]QBQ58761.1 hypothetical protein EYD13_01870 [Saccharomonospora xinjiangensis]